MRVVHLVPALFGPAGIVGGGERYAYELARHMSKSVPTTLVSFGSEEREEQVGDLRVRVIGDPWLVRGQRTNPMSVAMFGNCGRRTSFTVISNTCCEQRLGDLEPADPAPRLRQRSRRGRVGHIGVSVHRSMVPRAPAHQRLQPADSGHDRNDRARVISGGVDVEKFVPDATSGARGAALFVGRFLPHKGVTDLIRGLPDGMSLRLVGPEPDGETKTQLDTLSRGKAVTFLHGLDDTALVREYRQALPSCCRASTEWPMDARRRAGAVGTDAVGRNGVRDARHLHEGGEHARSRRGRSDRLRRPTQQSSCDRRTSDLAAYASRQKPGAWGRPRASG